MARLDRAIQLADYRQMKSVRLYIVADRPSGTLYANPQ